MLASPRRTQQVGCLGLWPGEHHERLLRLFIDRGKGSLGRTEPIVLVSRGPFLEFSGPGGGQSTRRPAKARKQAIRLFSSVPTDNAVRQLGLTRFIGGLSMDRILVKPRLYRSPKAGKIQLMDGGRHSTVTQEVKDKKRGQKLLLISNPNRYRRCYRYSAVAAGQSPGRPRIAALNGRCPAPAWFDLFSGTNGQRRGPAWF